MVSSVKTSICLVTPDLLGPVRNGGIGTACTFLAEELADAGYQVTILFSQCDSSASVSETWMRRYQAKGIEVVVAEDWRPLASLPVCPHHPALAMALTVHDWLAGRCFDLVFFMEWQGHGFYALQAKRAGLRFQNTVLVTQTHSPSLWHAVNNAELSSDPMSLLTYFMERKCVEWADVLISPSAYMLDWLRRFGFKPPQQAMVLPNLLQVSAVGCSRSERAHVSVNELVFFGRLEYRKGLAQFCDALDRLANTGTTVKVSFLGKFSHLGSEHSAIYIARRATKWPFAVKIHSRLDQTQALRYLQGKGRMAVMPSVADNSPYTVYECLAAGIPFLARNVGGVAELIDPRDRMTCLFNDNPNTLAECFAQVLSNGAPVPRLAFALEDNRMAWRRLVADLLAERKPGLPLPPPPKVSVCLVHYNRPKLLKQAVDSLLAQDYTNFEVILVDDGSPDKAARQMLDRLTPLFDQHGWRILRQANGYLGKARNTAARHANGDYLLFMDDDNVARPPMISRFVQAALSSDADLVTAMFDVFASDRMPTTRTRVVERFLPVGDIVSFSVLTNAIGDANALMRRSLFERLGGFSEDYGIGHEDFELYLRAVLNDACVCVVPEPLFWYRRNGESMLSATHAAANRMRSFRPFMEALPAPLAELAVMAFAALGQNNAEKTSNPLLRDLLAVERQKIEHGDPDAPDTVIAVANYLKRCHHVALANDMLEELETALSSPSQSSEAENFPALSLIRLLQTQETIDSYAALKKAFAKVDNDELAEISLLALSLLTESMTQARIVLVLVETLQVLSAESLDVQLLCAERLLQCDCLPGALESLTVALQLADQLYLTRRPDVAGAIDRGVFKNGFQHFFQHGRFEAVQWPSEQNFSRVIRQMVAKAGPSFFLTGKTEAPLILALAAMAFMPQDPTSTTTD